MEYTSVLVLTSGAYYVGSSFGKEALRIDEFSSLVQERAQDTSIDATLRGCGELVFNTAMSGYVEVLSDPSFLGQLVCMTYPHIGNYGVELQWSESSNEEYGELPEKKTPTIMVSGVIVRELYEGPVFGKRSSLHQWMHTEGIVGINNIDTRSLTLYLRDTGAMNAAIVQLRTLHFDADLQTAIKILQSLPAMEGQDLVSNYFKLRNSEEQYVAMRMPDPNAVRKSTSNKNIRVGILDSGCKQNILRSFEEKQCTPQLIYSYMRLEEILEKEFDMILVSNGPGDPAALRIQTTLIASLIGHTTLCGICLGAQLLALSIDAKTFKLPFGHHGINHPVRDEFTERLYITSQNHGFAIEENSLPPHAKIWFRNTNDETVEGFVYPEKKMYSVQFHPEAAPGPLDTLWVFDYFLERAREHQEHRASTKNATQ